MKAALDGLVHYSWLAGCVIPRIGGEKAAPVCDGGCGSDRVSVPSLGDFSGF